MTTKIKGIVSPIQQPNTDVSGIGFKTTPTANDYTVGTAWIFSPAFAGPINLIVPTLVVPNDFTIRGQDANAGFAATGGNVLVTPGIGTGGNSSGNLILKDSAGNGGAWNKSHPVLGAYHLWIDALGRVRIKSSAPTTDLDGNVANIDLVGSAVYDPPNLADGAGVTTTIGVATAALGDVVVCSFSLDLQGILMTAYVSAATVVSIRFQNESGGAIDLASGTIRVKIFKA